MTVIQKKVCLLGDFAVGKTSLVRRYVEGRFDEKYLSTIGVSISQKQVDWEDHTCSLLIWDLAGGERFSAYQSSYLRGAAGALLVSDLTRPETQAALAQYAQDIRSVNPSAALVFLGNKIDLLSEPGASQAELAHLARGYASPCYLTSAKTGQAIQPAILALAQQLIARHEWTKS